MLSKIRYAEKHHTPNPLHNNKVSVDQDFNEAVNFGIENIHQVAMCIGSHNIISCERALAQAKEDAIELSHPHCFLPALWYE